LAQSDALNGARAQIIWIVALILSTTAIIYLERLDIGAPGRSGAVSADLMASATQALAAAEQRHEASPKDIEAATALVLAPPSPFQSWPALVVGRSAWTIPGFRARLACFIPRPTW